MASTTSPKNPGRSLGVRTKILLVGGIGLAGALALGGVNVWAQSQVTDASHEIRSAANAQQAALNVASTFNAVNGAQKEYVLAVSVDGPKAVDPTDDHRKSFLAAAADLKKQLDSFPALTTDLGKASLGKVKSEFEAFNALDQRISGLLATGNEAQRTEADKLTLHEGGDVSQRARTAVVDLVKSTEQRIANASENADATARTATIIVVITLLLVIVAVAAVALWISKAILQAVTDVRNSMEAMGQRRPDGRLQCHHDTTRSARWRRPPRPPGRPCRRCSSQVGQASSTVAAASEELPAVATQVGATSSVVDAAAHRGDRLRRGGLAGTSRRWPRAPRR